MWSSELRDSAARAEEIDLEVRLWDPSNATALPRQARGAAAAPGRRRQPVTDQRAGGLGSEHR